jgi:hypothetical protein
MHASHPLIPEYRSLIDAAVHNSLNLFPDARTDDATAAASDDPVEMHLDELVEIVRQSNPDRPEGYLFQLLEYVCSDCPFQHPSGFCGRRHAGLCPLFRHTSAIVSTIGQELEAIGDEEYRRCHMELN